MDHRKKATMIVSEMTLEEKASLCSGANFWQLKAQERFGLPDIMMTDGPHGLRKQACGNDQVALNTSVPATCFPPACASACSFDRRLMFDIGQAIAEECRENDVAVILGPGTNIKRSPLGGRNFEYFSEDPYLSGEISAAFIDGVQSGQVGVSLKHFAANNQETRRLSIDSIVDERTLREIYLRAFETAVKKSQPWTIMCSYNKLCGVYMSENKRLLTDILRDEWGFDGVVVSDWGAVSDRVKGVEAGMDLEMPNVGPDNDRRIRDAVLSGELDETTLDKTAARVIELMLKAGERTTLEFSRSAHHSLARRAAAESAVLLKNNDGILPLKLDDCTDIAIIGAFAKRPRYQGAGSSKIQPTMLENAYDELCRCGRFSYAEGYDLGSDEPDERLIQQACDTAAGAKVAVVFAGLPDSCESEGFDRTDLKMPRSHVELIERVAAVNENTVVVLLCGGVVELCWEPKVKAILLGYLGGQAGGGAIADLLLGRSCPSGKLAETWCMRLEDNPSCGFFPGDKKHVCYGEGLMVGYRYYDTAQKPVRYPFGHGLSYTQFALSNMRLSTDTITSGDGLSVSCRIENTGEVAGSEVIQLYISQTDARIVRPEQELKGFEKVTLNPGEKADLRFELNSRDFAIYDAAGSAWSIPAGRYQIRLGTSSRNIALRDTVSVVSDFCPSDPQKLIEAIKNGEFAPVTVPPDNDEGGQTVTIDTIIEDIADTQAGGELIAQALAACGDDDLGTMMRSMLMESPLRVLPVMCGAVFTTEKLNGVIAAINSELRNQ